MSILNQLKTGLLQEGQTMDRLKPIIKWPGGKERELEIITSNMPKTFNDFFEPFVGGGSVFMALNARHYFINDKSSELVNLYRNIGSNNSEFINWSLAICNSWSSMKDFVVTHSALMDIYARYRDYIVSEKELGNIIVEFIDDNKHEIEKVLNDMFKWHRGVLIKECHKNLKRKITRMKKIEQEKGRLPEQDIFSNIETAFMSSLYMYYRYLYNDKSACQESPLSASVFLFIRNYAYSGMFRFNSNGDFNVPYGGIGYNSKNLESKLNYYNDENVLGKFNQTDIYCMDFEDFLEASKPGEGDFVFLDPPYDTDFSTYDKNDFDKDDQKRLANYFCNKCKANWMLIIKNTPFILSLYDKKGLNIRSFDKTYSVSFMNRNNRDTEHLLITNY